MELSRHERIHKYHIDMDVTTKQARIPKPYLQKKAIFLLTTTLWHEIGRFERSKIYSIIIDGTILAFFISPPYHLFHPPNASTIKWNMHLGAVIPFINNALG